MIPDGSFDSLFKAADLFDARYLVLEKDHVEGLDDLYNKPLSKDKLDYLGSVGTTKLFYIKK